MHRRIPRLPRHWSQLVRGCALAGLVALVHCSADRVDTTGANPHPVHLVRPAARPLSAVAELGRAIFFDPALSGSGNLACASCHRPDRAFGPPDDRAVQLGGRAGKDQGARAVPSLRYLDRIPNFSIGPENGAAENVNVGAAAARASGSTRALKSAGAAPVTPAIVPQGGLFWDGRVNTLQSQAFVPLMNPVEMANGSIAGVAGRLRHATYGGEFVRLFGAAAVATPARLLDEAMFAVARFEVEDSAFHPYSSKYDDYLEGKAVLTAAERRGLEAFENPAKGNCAACHLDRAGADGAPPLFSDFQYEALGVPRNDSLAQNRRPDYFDLGLCGPIRTDLRQQVQYCGMFRTPSLRNAATRHGFFHNGVYHSLADVLRFYAGRAVHADRIYPRRGDGTIDRYDDLPPAYRDNVDTIDPPFDRRPGGAPAMSDEDISDIIAFLGTLTDGYRAMEPPSRRDPPH